MYYVPYVNDFVVFENTPEVKLEDMPLADNPINITDWATDISASGTPIVTNNLPTATRSPSTFHYGNTSESLSHLSFEELAKQEGLSVKVTSSYRPGAKTKSGKTSHHSEKDEYGHPKAYDIVPTNGDFESLRKAIVGNPRIRAWLDQKGYGVLDETKPNVMAKTGATGKHFHIGPDPAALKSLQQMIAKGQEGMKVTPFVTFENPEPSQVEIEMPLLDKPITMDFAGVSQQGTPIMKNNLPTATRSTPTFTPPQDSTTESTDTVQDTSSRSIKDDFSEAKKKPLNDIITKLSKENPRIEKVRNFLLDTAAFESGYNSKSASKDSTASGWFGFLDSTKQSVLKAMGITGVTRQQFNNNPELQVRAAAKLYDMQIDLAKRLNVYDTAKFKGYSDDDIAHAFWLNPTWAKAFFLHGKNIGSDAYGTNIEKYLNRIHGKKGKKS